MCSVVTDLETKFVTGLFTCKLLKAPVLSSEELEVHDATVTSLSNTIHFQRAWI